jgi:hypothetical protein
MLQHLGAVGIGYHTLGGHAQFVAAARENGELEIRRATGSIYPVSQREYELVHARVNALPIGRQRAAIEYTSARWKQCPSAYRSPYVAAVILNLIIDQ